MFARDEIVGAGGEVTPEEFRLLVEVPEIPWALPGGTPVIGVVEAGFRVVVAVVARGEDAHREAFVLKVEGFSGLLLALGEPLDVFVIEKIFRVEGLPRFAAILTAGEVGGLNTRDVVAVTDHDVTLGEPYENFFAPLPHAIVGRPAVKLVFFDGGDVMFQVGGLLGCGETRKGDCEGEQQVAGFSHELHFQRSVGFRAACELPSYLGAPSRFTW